MAIKLIRDFIQLESASAIILIAATLLALVLANSPLQHFYTNIFHYPFFIAIKNFTIKITLNRIINDGLMSIFFLLVSLEVKRELIIGELNSRAKALLPCIAAAGGMILPAIIYVAINFNDADALQGWAIPTATDIAFSLAILTLLGSRIPSSLKTFLMALAIIDDLGAIVIIAIFYTNHLNLIYLLLAVLCLLILIAFNILNVKRFWPYGIVGILLWLCIMQSGVHATIAGVILGLTIPLRVKKERGVSLLKKIEHLLHPWVAYGILPLFALANAGLSFSDIHLSTLLNPLPLGITLGLFFGKQFGILGASWLAIKTKIVVLPCKTTWPQLYGVSLICGIGFTMSLFIGTLAFSDNGTSQMGLVKLGVLIGSLCSAIAGYCVLRKSQTERLERA